MPELSGFCPRPTDTWSAIKKKVGLYEAYRLYYKLGYELPDLAFKDDNEVWNLVKQWDGIRATSIDGKPKRLYITYKDNNTYQTNRESVRKKIDHINKVYDNLLIIGQEPIPQDEAHVNSPYFSGRKFAEFVDINPNALKEHYSIYEDRLKELQVDQNYDLPMYEQRVDYAYKSANIITNNISKINQWFKQIGNNDTFWNKIQKDLGIPKVQLDLIKESEGSNIEEKLSSFLANYSYSVETNTTIKKEVRNNLFDWDHDITEEDFGQPTNYYSNLTVPGGTNYTENEISTPLITPSIKGHAKFSTDQGIGWFRSDERAETYYDSEVDAYIVKTESTGDLFEDAFGTNKKRIPTDTKTRRILEIQSDLFQKGRDKEKLIPGVDRYISKTQDGKYQIYIGAKGYSSGWKQLPELYNTKEEAQKELDNLGNLKQNQFLQLLNKDNNWVTFFIKSIIQDSAKKGYEKVLFPKGETAAKIEGHTTIADEIKVIDKQLEDVKNNKGNVFNANENYYAVLEGNMFKTQKEAIDFLETKKQELKSQGIEKLKPIEAFYEIKIGNILEKQFGKDNVKTITDEYDNQWREIEIKPERDLKDIEFQRQSNLTPENRVDFERKKEQLLKLYPQVERVIEDVTIPQAGLLEAGGKVIRVNPNLWYKDTLGHEFGHIMIDSLGYNNPLVQRAITLLKDSKLEHRLRETYKDIYESNPEKYWKEVVTQAVGEEVSNIFDNQKDRGDFQRWLDRFIARLKQLFGLERDAIKVIAQKVIYEGVQEEVLIERSEQRTAADDFIEEIERNITKEDPLAKLYEQAKSILEKKIKIYRKSGKEAILDNFKVIYNKIEQLDKDPVEALKLFTTFAVNQTSGVYSKYLEAKIKQTETQDPHVFNLKDLKKWRQYVSAFNMLEDMVKLAREIMSERSTDPKMKEFIKLIDKVDPSTGRNILDETIKRKNEIRDEYLKAGSDLLIKRITPYSTHIEAGLRDKLERDYNALTKTEKELINKEDFIKEQLELTSLHMHEATAKLLQKELLTGTRDINSAERWFDNLLDSPDVIVSTLMSFYLETDRTIRLEKIKLKSEILEHLRSIEKDYGNLGISDPTKLFDTILEQGELGNTTGYLIDMVNSGMWRSYNDLKATLAKSTKSEEEKAFEVNAWKEENAPLDKKAYREGKEHLLTQLLEAGLITEKDIRNLKKANKAYTESGARFSIEDVWKNNHEACEAYNKWRRENTWSYRRPIDKWINPEYLKILSAANEGTLPQDYKALTRQEQTEILSKSKDSRVKFLAFLRSTTDETQQGVPFDSRLFNRLPGINKDTRERMLSKSNSIKDVLYHSVTDNFNILEDDIERGTTVLTDEANNPVYFVPIYYTKALDVKDQSFDIGGIYYKYFANLIEYKHKQEILPEMELANEMLKDRQIAIFDRKGNPKVDTVGRAQYKEKRGGNIADQYDEWLKAMFYGIKQKDLGRILGGRVDVAKALQKLNKYTSLNMLGFNFVQGVSNLVTGETMQWIEAAGGRFYNSKNYINARIFYHRHLIGVLDDVGKRAPNSLLGKFAEEFDFLNEYEEGKFRVNSKLRSLMHSSSAFFFSKAGEHFMQTSAALAMLDHLRAEDSNGNDIGSMLECMRLEDDKLVFKSSEGIEVANFDAHHRKIFEGQLRRKLSAMHGEYTEAGRVAAQNHAAMNLVLTFRKFIIPGMRRRWGKKRHNNILGEEVSGDYITAFKFFGQLLKDMKSLRFDLIKTDWDKLLDREKYQVYKTSTELAFMAAAIILSTVLINMKDEDDDDEWLLNFLAYQSLRYRAEMWFFANPLESFKILRSPAAAVSMLENTLKLFGQLMPPTFEGFEEYERGPRKGQLKIRKTTSNLIPGPKQIYRTLYPEDLINMFK